MPLPTPCSAASRPPSITANVPTAVFSEPEVGTVGLTEAQARARLAQTDIYKAMFKPLKATLSGRDTTVLMKLVVDGMSDRVVGCHVVGEGAAEMAQVAAVAVKMGANKADFDATMALHPTAAEELVTMRKKTRELRPGSRGIGGISRAVAAAGACVYMPPSFRPNRVTAGRIHNHRL